MRSAWVCSSSSSMSVPRRRWLRRAGRARRSRRCRTFRSVCCTASSVTTGPSMSSAKLNSLPYWEAASALLEAEKKRAAIALFPRCGRAGFRVRCGPRTGNRPVFFARTRLDRKFAARRCLEALRLYAAGHEGKAAGQSIGDHGGADSGRSLHRQTVRVSPRPATGQPSLPPRWRGRFQAVRLTQPVR